MKSQRVNGYFRRSDDRAVSEALGQILVFGIVITGIGLIVLMGSTIIDSTKETNNLQNIEQGFKVVQSGMNRVALEKTPVTTARMHIGGGTLYTDMNSSTISVAYPGLSYPTTKMGELAFTANGKHVSVQNGGLWMSYGTENDDVMVLAPRIYGSLYTGTIVVNVIRITGDESSFGGAGTTSIAMEYKDTDVHQASSVNPLGDSAVITIKTEYPNAWGRCLYERFTEDGFTVDDPVVTSPDTVTITVKGVKSIIVCEHQISVKPIVYNS